MPTRGPLRVSPVPFKPSFLSIPPSPFSPRTPLTPILPPKPPSRPLNYAASPTTTTCPNNSNSNNSYPNLPPTTPLPWMWTCHQCHTSYALGTTRRCLDDGHHFCSGVTTIQQWRKPCSKKTRIKKHGACGSEFDYEGWKAWGRWRRDVIRGSRSKGAGRIEKQQQMKKKGEKDCYDNCNYPSECRWGKKHGVHTPVEQDQEQEQVAIDFPSPQQLQRLSIEAGDGKLSMLTETLKSGDVAKNTRLEWKDEGRWDALRVSAEKRNRSGGTRRASSPLSTVIEVDGTSIAKSATDPEAPRLDGDGDVEMNDALIDLYLDVPAQTTSNFTSETTSAVDSLKALIGKGKSRRFSKAQRQQGKKKLEQHQKEETWFVQSSSSR